LGIRPVKTVGRITDIVLVQPLNHAPSISQKQASLIKINAVYSDYLSDLFAGFLCSQDVSVVINLFV